MSQLKAVLFDVDGTLADTERDGHRVAFNLAFKEAGLDWHWSESLYGKLLAVTGGKERIKYYLSEFRTDFQKPAQFDAFVKGLHEAKTAHYVQLLSDGAIPLRPGVKRLIEDVREAGITMAIVTTTTPANVTALLNATLGHGSERLFACIAAGDIVPAKKPAPDIYHWAMQTMGVSADECVALEDSYNGVQSSVQAGIRTLITTNAYTENEDFTGASLVLDQLGEPNRPANILANHTSLTAVPYVNVSVLQQLV